MGTGQISGAQVLPYICLKTLSLQKQVVLCFYTKILSIQKLGNLKNRWNKHKEWEISSYSRKLTQTEKQWRCLSVSSIRRGSMSLSFCCPQGERLRSLCKLRSCDFHQLNLWCFSDALKSECRLWYIFKNQWSDKFKEASDHAVLQNV